MASHHRSTTARLGRPGRTARQPAVDLPPLPNNVGRHTSWKNIHGVRRTYIILDEIRRVQSSHGGKVLVLQKLKREDGVINLRLGYYMIGVKPRMAGKWVWGQFATMIPATDFRAIIKAAEQRRWI